MSRSFIPLLIFTLLQPFAPYAQEASDEDALRAPFFENWTGKWEMHGTVQGDSVLYDTHIEWVLKGNFFRISMRDTADPPGYTADVYIGHDSDSGHYVGHWLDEFGGGRSKTIGIGAIEGDTLRFRFPYDSGPFQTFFIQQRSEEWKVLMRSRKENGWQRFASFRMLKDEG